MSTTTGIEWTDATWNPVRGCSRVSEGCRNCYAERTAARFTVRSRMEDGINMIYGGPFQEFVTTVNGHPAWTGKVELIPDKLLEPLSWRKPQRIFVNSMSDLFHEALPDSAIDQVFAVMARARQHTFQILTKRPERMRAWAEAKRGHLSVEYQDLPAKSVSALMPLDNVWLGVSVEDQETADIRIPPLLRTPAAKRFGSYEPALGPVSFRWARWDDYAPHPSRIDQRPPVERDGKTLAGCVDHLDGLRLLDWVIAGGESGPGARPPHPQWFRDARDQCQAAGVPFFFKQWGEWGPTVTGGNAMKGYKYANVPVGDGSHHRMVRVGKKLAGRLLDGAEWSEFPK